MPRGTQDAKRQHSEGDTDLIKVLVDEVGRLRVELDALYAKMDADFADVTNASVDYATSQQIAAHARTITIV